MMPSYINIGAHVGPGTMVDTWPPLGAVPRSALASTSPEVSVSAACWSHPKLHP